MRFYLAIRNLFFDIKSFQLQVHTLIFSHVDKKASGTSTIYKNNGSATLEAVLILPIFVFMILFIYGISMFYMARASVYSGLEKTAVIMARNTYVFSLAEESLEIKGDTTEYMLNMANAYRIFRNNIDDEASIERYVSGGKDGVVFAEAYEGEDGYLYLKAVYKIEIEIPVFGKYSKTVSSRVKQKTYKGKSLMTYAADEDFYVYVTDYESVYHKSRTCYHINLSINKVSSEDLKQNYAYLKACEFCTGYGESPSSVFVTKEGDCFHLRRNCSGLKRSVRRVKKSECGVRTPCSNCGG